MQRGGLSPVALLLKKAAWRAHSHKAPRPCKLGVDWEGSGLTLGMGILGQSCHAVPLPTPTHSQLLPAEH